MSCASAYVVPYRTIFIVLYILYSMVSAQQTNLLPENPSQNDDILDQKSIDHFHNDVTILRIFYSWQKTLTLPLFR